MFCTKQTVVIISSKLDFLDCICLFFKCFMHCISLSVCCSFCIFFVSFFCFCFVSFYPSAFVVVVFWLCCFCCLFSVHVTCVSCPAVWAPCEVTLPCCCCCCSCVLNRSSLRVSVSAKRWSSSLVCCCCWVLLLTRSWLMLEDENCFCSELLCWTLLEEELCWTAENEELCWSRPWLRLCVSRAPDSSNRPSTLDLREGRPRLRKEVQRQSDLQGW